MSLEIATARLKAATAAYEADPMDPQRFYAKLDALSHYHAEYFRVRGDNSVMTVQRYLESVAIRRKKKRR